jgi:putative ABC transport system permease protein
MQFYLSALTLGLAMCCLGWGIFLSMKVFNIPDITTDGSYTLGAAISAVHLSQGGSWWVALILSILGGAVAGCLTGFIHTRLKVNALLAGILVMTALYSINLMLMGRSNIPLLDTSSLFNAFGFESNVYVRKLIQLSILIAFPCVMLIWLLKTDFGLAMRATGNSETMVRSMGVNTNRMKMTGLAIANALTALSGSIVTQLQQFADINMGIGIVIFGLGAVMIGETVMGLLLKTGIAWRIIGVILGCLIFRLIIAFTLASGADPNLLKLITAGVVLVFVSLPVLRGKTTFG